ncbi:MAG TPA: HWE histidine kinase domain-containing protein [Microvirga sp.]
MTLTRRLLLLALISILPATVIWTYTEVSLRRAREAEVHDLARRQAQLAASELERIFEGIRNLLVVLGEVPAIRALDTPACVAYLATLQPKIPHLLSISALDLDGRVRCRQETPPETMRFNDRSYFQEAVAEDGFVIGEYTDGRVALRPILPLAMPLKDAGGRTIGVVAAALDLEWLGQRLRERAVPEGGSITVADRRGRIIAREPLSERFLGTAIPENFQRYITAKEPGSMEVVSQDGTRRVLGYVPATHEPRNIYVSAGLSSKQAYGPIDQAAKRGFLLIAVSFILALSLAWLSGRAFVTTPFGIMTHAVRSWRRGNYRARIDLPRSSGELGLLAEAFNDLMDDVAERQRALRESEEQARLALEAGEMGTWWINPTDRKSGWSQKTAALLGLPVDASTTTLDAWTRLIHPDDVPWISEQLEAALRGEREYDVEYRLVREDGTETWLNSRGRVFFNVEGKAVHMLGIVFDITARKKAEEQQRLLLDELNHRVKNTLATVQSIASQTLRTAADPAEFRTAFEGRLLALSKTHDLLTRNAWRDADLRAIADQELRPYGRDGDDRVTVSGPQLRLPARMAINLGLVLHELATNAAKYGALSVPQGRLALTWRLEPGACGKTDLHLSWREFDGPKVAPPNRKGFGSRLIQRSLEGELNGRAALDFPPTGARCEIVIPFQAGTPVPDEEQKLAVAV